MLVAGIILFTLGDVASSPTFAPIGVALIAGALCIDAVCANFEEKNFFRVDNPSAGTHHYMDSARHIIKLMDGARNFIKLMDGARRVIKHCYDRFSSEVNHCTMYSRVRTPPDSLCVFVFARRHTPFS